MPTRRNTYTLPVAVTAQRATEKALLVAFDEPYEGEEETWVPQSQIDEDSEVWKPGDVGQLVVSHWFAKQRGWTEDE